MSGNAPLYLLLLAPLHHTIFLKVREREREREVIGGRWVQGESKYDAVRVLGVRKNFHAFN
jgi:hypothetical protein